MFLRGAEKGHQGREEKRAKQPGNSKDGGAPSFPQEVLQTKKGETDGIRSD